jgi:hypothetical protein
MTPAAGAEDLLALQHVLAAAEDRWLPLKMGTESTRRGLAVGILYRTGKFIGLDIPQDHLLMVLAHEVFGHGARFRELGEGTIGYGFDAPIPYGSGDAFTRFEGRFPASPLAHLNVSASGIEAQHSLADGIAARVAARGRMHYREAWLYFESRLTGMTYILTARPNSVSGHDVQDFIERFPDACHAPCSPLTRNYLQRRALLALGDPMLYYAIYGFAAAYIGNGELTGPVPMIPMGRDLRVLPSLGYALAPYGAEWIVRTAVQTGGTSTGARSRLHSATLRVGDTGATTTWGVGVRGDDVLRLKGLRFDAALDVWRQPDLLADQTSDDLHMGFEATGTVVLPIPRRLRSPYTNGIHITAGYKRQGYVPGEQLSGGLVLRAGIQIR